MKNKIKLLLLTPLLLLTGCNKYATWNKLKDNQVIVISCGSTHFTYYNNYQYEIYYKARENNIRVVKYNTAYQKYLENVYYTTQYAIYYE